MVEKLIAVLFGILFLCNTSIAENIAPMGDGGGVLLQAATGTAEDIETNSVCITSEIVCRDKNVIVYIEYGINKTRWTRSEIKAIEQNKREKIKIKIQQLLPGTTYHYRCVARGKTRMTRGNIYSFKTKP